jgi:hypothetical protein
MCVHCDRVGVGVLCFCEFCLLDMKKKIFEFLMALCVKIIAFFDVCCVVW